MHRSEWADVCPHTLAALNNNGNGTVTDTATHLIRDRCVLGYSGNDCATGTETLYTWANALLAVNTANANNHLGFNDWRLPNINELGSLIKIDVLEQPAIDSSFFPNTPRASHWSSTTQTATPTQAWVGRFDFGNINASLKTVGWFVRLVRSGQPSAAFDALPPVNGTCGSAHSTTPVLTAPSANLCTTGTASSITSNAANFTWTCAGASGGSTANCSATRGYAVAASAGVGGSINPSGTQAVALNATASFIVSANAGHVIHSVTGCGGSLSGNSYTTHSITGDCSVSASFTTNDSTPDAFGFDTLRDVPINTQQTSNAITVSGINTAASIAIQNGEYQLNNGAWTAAAGVVNNGDSVKVRHISGGTYGTAIVTSVQIGGVQTTFITVTPHLANTGGGGTDLNTPPAPPPPPPPTIESGSTIDSTGGTYQVAPSAADPNAPGRLRVRGTVVLQPQGNNTSPKLQLSSTADNPAQFGFVLDSQGRMMPRLLSGSATLQSNTTDLQPLLAWLRANTVVAVAGLSCGPATPSAVLVRIDPITQQTQLSVLSCGIVLSDTPSPSPSNPIARNTTTPPTAPSYFSGETLTLNPEGDITAVHLGSADQRGITGDPISNAHTPSNLTHRSSTPRLSGNVARVQRDLPTLLADTLRHNGYPSPIVSGDTGQVSAQVNGQRQQWQAVGPIRIDTTTPATSSIQPNPQGGLSINALGINIELVPSALQLTSLAHALHTLGGTLQVQPHTLWPEFILSPIPPNRNGQTFWFDHGKLFISLPQPSGLAQGFVLK